MRLEAEILELLNSDDYAEVFEGINKAGKDSTTATIEGKLYDLIDDKRWSKEHNSHDAFHFKVYLGYIAGAKLTERDC